MRTFLAATAAAAIVGVGALMSTTALAIGPAALGSAIERVNPAERVGRVCREVCSGDVCRRRCFNRADHNEGYTERRIYRERYRDDDRWRPRDYDRGRGVRLHLGFRLTLKQRPPRGAVPKHTASVTAAVPSRP